MKDPQERFLEQIKNALQRHEESYDEGAWERFAAKNAGGASRPKAKPVMWLWKWAAAAAAIAAGAILVLQFLHRPELPNIQAGAPTQSVSAAPQVAPDSNSVKAGSPPKQEASPGMNTELQRHNQAIVHIRADNIQLPESTTRQATLQPTPDGAVQPSETITPPPAKKTEVPFYQNQIVKDEVAIAPPAQKNHEPTAAAATTHPQQTERREKNSRWLSSLYVSPTFGNHDVNMAYGYQLGYAVNDRIRISSGIAYARVSTSKNFHTPGSEVAGVALVSSTESGRTPARATNIMAESPATVQSVSAWLSGIDVPLEINYEISKKFYASGGVSGLIVVNGATKKTFPAQAVNVRVETPEDRIREEKNVAMSNLQQSDVQGESTPFLGFYNLSLGFRQKVSQSNSVSVEPFIKVPMKQVTAQKLNYTGVGLRLKFDF